MIYSPPLSFPRWVLFCCWNICSLSNIPQLWLDCKRTLWRQKYWRILRAAVYVLSCLGLVSVLPRISPPTSDRLPTQMSRLVVGSLYGWELTKWIYSRVINIYIFYKYLLSKSSEYCRFFMVSSDKAAHTNVSSVPHRLALMLFNLEWLAQHSDSYHQDWSVT